MDSKINRSFLFNSSKSKNEGHNLGKAHIKNGQYLNLPLLTINSIESNYAEKSVEDLKKLLFQNKVTINDKRKELQVLKIQYSKFIKILIYWLIKENRTYKKVIFEVLDLHDEARNSSERKDIIKENVLESSYISEEQLLNKINLCRINNKQKEKLQNSFEMLNLKEELNSKRTLLLNKRKEYNDLKHGVSIKNMNEMNSKLEEIRVNEVKLQNEVSSLEERLSKNDEIIKQLEKEIQNEEKLNEDLTKQDSEYESKFNNKIDEIKEISKDISMIDLRRKNKITKLTNSPNYEGVRMKECRLKSKIAQMKKDINKIDEYEKARNELIKSLEQKREAVSELKKKNAELEKDINDIEQKNTKLYIKMNTYQQEKIALENRGKEQIKDIKRLQELENVLIELKIYKDKLIKDLENININDKNKKIEEKIKEENPKDKKEADEKKKS